MPDYNPNVERDCERPRTLAQARILIAKVYTANDWDEGLQRAYERGKGLTDDKPLEERTKEELHIIVTAMESGKMVGFRD